jgi:glycosyltransferase involved in cell wall biosynthesis
MDVSVIICAYTELRWSELVAAVKSVHSQDTPPREIIVVIDHNPRLFERLCREIEGVIATQNREAPGLSGARNTGVAMACGQLIAFLDEDAVAEPDWLMQLGARYGDPLVFGVGGGIEPNWVDGRPAWFPEEFNWVVGCTYRGMPDRTAPVRNLIGCNMSFRREVFQIDDGFRNGIGRVGTLPVGCEETEFCIRLSQRRPQSQLLHEPMARVRHRVPAGRATWRYFLRRCYSEGISKALVARFVGAGDGLASERDYVLRTLPRGILRGVADAMLRHDLLGLARSGAIVCGLGLTAAGYMAGSLANVVGDGKRSIVLALARVLPSWVHARGPKLLLRARPPAQIVPPMGSQTVHESQPGDDGN